MRHAKRGVLTTEDINNTLRLRNVQVLSALQALCLPFSTNMRCCDEESVLFKATLTSSPSQRELRPCRGAQPLYGFASKDPARFLRAAGHGDPFYVQDPLLSFDQASVLGASLLTVPACTRAQPCVLQCRSPFRGPCTERCSASCSVSAK